MKKKALTFILISAVTAHLIGGCAAPNSATNQTQRPATTQSEEISSASQIEENIDNNGESAAALPIQQGIGNRPLLIQTSSGGTAPSVTPRVAPYTIEPDLSNIENLWQFYYNETKTALLVKNGFVVSENGGHEFFEGYEQNRYNLIPNFVTVDSLMHTYHLYFSHLLKNIEKEALSQRVLALSNEMLQESIAQYQILKDSEWESAAKCNVAFFTVGAMLLDENTVPIDDVKDIVQTEYANIREAGGIALSEITGDAEDYSQYIPRGYYEGSEQLEKYFQAMMWYGRIHFRQDNEALNRSALLITKALTDNTTAYELWQAIYAVTSFFAGASDDLSVCEYAPILKEIYGDSFTVDALIGNTDAFAQFCMMTAQLPIPLINSIPIADDENNVIKGFRFMGQRFSIDAAIMQQLIYSNVQENSQGLKRMLPDVLDVPAALGSDLALQLLQEDGATDYANYTENMERLRNAFSKNNQTLWSASLYANWLNTLRPLLERKGEGYPMFMQNEEWAKKNLECFAGSFTELKHDTVLYSKQVMAEMGGGYDEEPDDRGYVEPEPVVYTRFATLADQTAQGLKTYGMLNSADEENLSRLSQIANQLFTISNKELQEETLTDEEYEFIRTYGGLLEHFWYDAIKDEANSEHIFADEYPAAVVVDVATDPNGTVLEMATGGPAAIEVVVKVDGKLKIARGSVYSFYQFPWPLDDRLTDSKWRHYIGMQADDEGNYNYEVPEQIQKPDWTETYRYHWE
ncbi:MAG: DUF3160 domain-containing protein [Lachnospiraceae bacterium]|nr:DUF3160 domain-containing protein [Lachnospiraceae bacterium]